jgi:hypothetical protein
MRKLSKAIGGYAKRKQQPIEKTKTEISTKPVKPPQPLPEGVGKALTAMAHLSRHLKPIVKVAYTVSIDVINSEWVLVVRGWKPDFDYYMGYPVKHIPSQFIRNPMSKS